MKSSGAAFAVCGGGTGGHIFPALAVAEKLRQLAPDKTVCYFGKTDGMEEKLIKQQPVQFYGLVLKGFSRSFSWRNLVSLWQAVLGFFQARKLLRDLKVRVILGTGGYVCGPVIAAAISRGIPSIIHESNFTPGLTNRILAWGVKHIAVSQIETGKFFSSRKVRVTGFPLRPGLNEVTRERSCKIFGLDPAKLVFFIFPGSLAARRINHAVAEMLPELKEAFPDLQIIWMTGEADLNLAQKAAAGIDLKISLHAFIQAVPEAYAAADLVLARAGAGTVAELSATGRPALLVPYPFATANHQMHNALLLQKQGLAEVVLDKDVTPSKLLERTRRLLTDLPAMKKCGTAIQAKYSKQAARELARLMIEIAGN